MANGITIMGNEPYAEWIERDGTAQRLFKAYCDKWPEGDTQCVAIGGEFYVRFNNGDGMRRERGRQLVEGRLSAPELCYTLPSRNLRPLHHYAQMATVMTMADVEPISLYTFRLHHAYSDDLIWAGYEYLYRHGETAMRVVANIVRSRVARASHGKPTVEPLERTALRLYKRAGRPELNTRYANIRKHIAATRGND